MNIENQARSLELYIIDGNPDGILTAEGCNWRGYVLVAPRLQISRELQRPEAGYRGICLLLGEQDHNPLAAKMSVRPGSRNAEPSPSRIQVFTKPSHCSDDKLP